MPKSKRAKVVHLTKVTKKGKDLSLKTYAAIHALLPTYPHLYVFSTINMRTSFLKDVRASLASDSRILLGKSKVMKKALGDSPATEPAPNTHQLSPLLGGAVGLLFSPRTAEEVVKFFKQYRPMDFARAGTVATRGFVLPAGVVYATGGEMDSEGDLPLEHNLEPGLRKLGVPTRLVKGKVMLENDYVVCREGEVLGSGQTTLLKMFGVRMAEFAVVVRGYWVRDTGEVIVLDDGEVGGEVGAMEVDVAEGDE